MHMLLGLHLGLIRGAAIHAQAAERRCLAYLLEHVVDLQGRGGWARQNLTLCETAFPFSLFSGHSHNCSSICETLGVADSGECLQPLAGFGGQLQVACTVLSLPKLAGRPSSGAGMIRRCCSASGIISSSSSTTTTTTSTSSSSGSIIIISSSSSSSSSQRQRQDQQEQEQPINGSLGGRALSCQGASACADFIPARCQARMQKEMIWGTCICSRLPNLASAYTAVLCSQVESAHPAAAPG